MRVRFGVKTLCGLLAAMLLGAAVAQDGATPESWYTQSYAALWVDKPAENVDAILAHYAPTIVTHAEDGSVSSDPRREWLEEPMQGWVAEGWLRAELVAVDTTEINATTASFTAIWQDYYADGRSERSCGWYLADKMDGEWQITHYADSPCP